MQEEALLLGPARSLAGVFTPATQTRDDQPKTALICLTAGLLHHVGPHRLHVLLARAIAGQGISTLRFDLSGIGDSATRTDGLSAQASSIEEINAAIAELEKRGYTRFILFGICSGAVQATKVALGNDKIAGLVLLNTGNDTSSSETNPQAGAQYYLKRSLWNPRAWKNLVTGRVKYRDLFYTLFAALKHRLINLLPGERQKNLSMEETLKRGVAPFIEQGTAILVVLSDRHAQFFELHRDAIEALETEQFKVLMYPQTDHLFTSLAVQQELIEQVCRWSANLAGPGQA
ncbi:MAG TPA: alpha/beta fold hydrolase [Thiotrichales bacterium]|nr:alpha/beta fold hydrolase [Thiotrichales bacterium]